MGKDGGCRAEKKKEQAQKSGKFHAFYFSSKQLQWKTCFLMDP
jgi:hypothetical protein